MRITGEVLSTCFSAVARSLKYITNCDFNQVIEDFITLACYRSYNQLIIELQRRQIWAPPWSAFRSRMFESVLK